MLAQLFYVNRLISDLKFELGSESDHFSPTPFILRFHTVARNGFRKDYEKSTLTLDSLKHWADHQGIVIGEYWQFLKSHMYIQASRSSKNGTFNNYHLPQSGIKFGSLRKGFTIEQAVLLALQSEHTSLASLENELHRAHSPEDLNASEFKAKGRYLNRDLNYAIEIITTMEIEVISALKFSDDKKPFLEYENILLRPFNLFTHVTGKELSILFSKSLFTRESLRQWFNFNGFITFCFEPMVDLTTSSLFNDEGNIDLNTEQEEKTKDLKTIISKLELELSLIHI